MKNLLTIVMLAVLAIAAYGLTFCGVGALAALATSWLLVGVNELLSSFNMNSISDQLAAIAVLTAGLMAGIWSVVTPVDDYY